MIKKLIHAVFLLVALSGLAAAAQTDVSLSLYGAFTGTSTGNSVQQSPANTAGGMIAVRHIRNPLFGWEGSYSFNGDHQTYTPIVSCGIPCGPATPAAVPAHAHQLTADYIVSIKLANLRPFALAGGGLIFNQPASATQLTQSSSGMQLTQSSTRGVFVYGAGLDWGLLPHIGLRFQYRGNVYRAPEISTVYTSSGAFLHTAEPMIGAYFRF